MIDFLDIFRNKVFGLTVLSWAISQGLKVIFGLIKEKRFDFNWIFRPGGMPSSHTAGMATLTFSLGKEFGFSSSIFALAFVIMIMTMFDAQTWRRSIGVQAKILNRIMVDVKEHKKIKEDRLRELLGHSPIEVFIGALIGIAICYLFYP